MADQLGTYPRPYVGRRAAAPPTHPDPDDYAAARAEQQRTADQPAAGPPPRSAVDWRLAGSLVVLGDEANRANPNRDKASDGTIGNAAHAAQGDASDHNPWVLDPAGQPVVRARDIDVDGLDLPAAFEKARAYAAAGWLPQLTNGGYLILNRRITAEDWSGWRTYTGPNPHTLHGHVSVSVRQELFDDRRPWLIFTDNPMPGDVVPATPPVPAPAPQPVPSSDPRVLQIGSTGDLVSRLQTRLRTRFPLYARRLVTDGMYGPATAAAVSEFQRRSPGLVVDGIAGPLTLRRLGL